MKINHAYLVQLKAELGRPLHTLCALAHINDPFFADHGARREAADWFVALWRRFRLGHGVHLRRIHYVLISQAKPVNGIHEYGRLLPGPLQRWPRREIAAAGAD